MGYIISVKGENKGLRFKGENKVSCIISVTGEFKWGIFKGGTNLADRWYMVNQMSTSSLSLPVYYTCLPVSELVSPSFFYLFKLPAYL